jgi:WD40 repeat protein
MSLAWSKDGSRLVSGSYDRTVRVWNADGSLAGVLTGHLGNVQCVAFLPDGARVISAAGGEGDDSVRLWERLDVEPLRVLVPEGHRSVAVALSSTGHWYALYSSGGERLTMLRGVRGDRRFERRELAARSNVLELDVSPDGRWIAVATRDGALLYEASSWDSAFALLGSTRVPLVPVRTLPSNASRARGIRFGARGELLVGHMNGDVALWDHERGELLHHLRIPGGTAHDVELDPAGRCIAALSRKHLAIWDRASATLLHERTDLPYGGALALDPQGRRFALAVGERDPEIEIYDLELARSTALLRGPTEEITGLAFSPDGRRLAVASGDRLVRLYDAESGILTLTLRDHGYLVKSVVWSPDGNALASCGRDGILVIRETEPLTPTPR